MDHAFYWCMHNRARAERMGHGISIQSRLAVILWFNGNRSGDASANTRFIGFLSSPPGDVTFPTPDLRPPPDF